MQMESVVVLIVLVLALVLRAGSTAHAHAAPNVEIDWYPAEEWGVNGKGWNDTLSYYDRLPAKAEQMVPTDVWNLSRHSTGMYVEFETDSPAIYARWHLTLSRLAMAHMPATSVSGVDLYAMNDAGEWRWVAVGRPEVYSIVQQRLIDNLSPDHRRYRLYLPLHNGVTSVEIGVPKGAKFSPVPPYAESPIVFYGTSIIHGLCASRAGMCATGILGRRLKQPIINLGFSGRARMEPELAELLAELDAKVYVLDAFPNMNAELIDERFEGFVRLLREKRPTTPIVVVEDRAFANTPFMPVRQDFYRQTRASIEAAWERLTAELSGLHFVSRDGIFGYDDDATVDGSHPTDLGFYRYSDVLEPVLRTVLAE